MTLGTIVALAAAFACGSLPFGPWLVRLRGGPSLRSVGSGNIGATNVARAAGLGTGVLTLVLDAAKGAGGVVIGHAIAGPHAAADLIVGALLVALPVAGHCFSPFVGFRGGKGVASAIGVLLVIDPLLAGAALAAFLVVVLKTRFISAGSLTLVTVACAGSWWRHGFGSIAVGASIVALLVTLRHRDNIRRLLSGTERKVGRSGDGS